MRKSHEIRHGSDPQAMLAIVVGVMYGFAAGVIVGLLLPW